MVLGYRWNWNRTVAMGLTKCITVTVAFGPVPTRNPWSCAPGVSTPRNFWNYHHIGTWCIRKRCSLRSCFTCRTAILNLSNIHCVLVKDPQFGCDFVCLVVTTAQILIGVHIGDQGVKAHVKLQLLHIDNVMIGSELENIIGVTTIGTAKWNCCSCSNAAKKRAVYVQSRSQLRHDKEGQVFG
jgi:hypothetical protein